MLKVSRGVVRNLPIQGNIHARCNRRPVRAGFQSVGRQSWGLPQSWGCGRQEGIVAPFGGGEIGRVAWILRLVEIGAEGDGLAHDVMGINRPGNLGSIAVLGLTLSETKRLLAALQREIAAAQVRTYQPEVHPPGSRNVTKKQPDSVAIALLLTLDR